MNDTICLTPERTNSSSTEIHVSEIFLPNEPRTVYLNDETVILEIRRNDIITRFSGTTCFTRVKNEPGEFEINNIKIIIEETTVKFQGFSSFKIRGNTFPPSSYQTPVRPTRVLQVPERPTRPVRTKRLGGEEYNVKNKRTRTNHCVPILTSTISYPPPPPHILTGGNIGTTGTTGSVLEIQEDEVNEEEIKRRLKTEFLNCYEKYDKNIKNLVVSSDCYNYDFDVYQNDKEIKKLSFVIGKNFYKTKAVIVTDKSNGKKFCLSCSKESPNVLENIFKGIIRHYCVSNNESSTAM